MEMPVGLLLHYYFKDDTSHEIDALLRNKCEGELLALIHEVAKTLGAGININSRLPDEGGFKDVWRILGENHKELQAVAAIAAIVGILIAVVPTEGDRLHRLDTELSIEERKLQIQKLKKELSGKKVSEESIEDVAGVLAENLKVITRRSNLYKSLLITPDVTKIGLGKIDDKGRLTSPEKIVERTQFPRFILKTNELKPEVDDEAVIEIISPVLKEGRYHWKGIYRDEPISFAMTDSDFKVSVLNELVSFKHGSTIVCILNINRKLDEVGEVVITSYSVSTVIQKNDGALEEEFPQGRRYRFVKKQNNSQGSLFEEG